MDKKKEKVRPLPPNKQGGFSILIVLTALVIISVVFVSLSRSLLLVRQAVIDAERKNVAINHAVELLEAFQALSTLQFATYLNNVPPSSASYRLCTHINIHNRENGTMLNPDPTANIARTSPIQNHASARVAASRFYRVQVVNVNDLSPNNNACNKLSNADIAGGNCGVIGDTYKLCENERFLVMVGVTYVPSGKTVSDVQRIVVSGILPGQLL